MMPEMQVLRRMVAPTGVTVAALVTLSLPGAAPDDGTFHLPLGIKLKAGIKSSVTENRFEDFSECVVGTPSYSERYPAEILAAFNGEMLAAGMPVEFADMVLGPITEEKGFHEWARSAL